MASVRCRKERLTSAPPATASSNAPANSHNRDHQHFMLGMMERV